MRSFYTFLVALAACAGHATSEAGIVLAVRGRPADACIRIASGAGPCVRYAADELAAYVRRMTGVLMPVEEKPGGAEGLKAAELRVRPGCGLGPEGYRLKASATGLLIEGETPRGVLFGVYGLLETFGGVEWLSWKQTVVPEREEFSVPSGLDATERPALDMRECSFEDARHPDFAAHLRLNGPAHGLLARHGADGRHEFVRGLGRCHTLPSLMPAKEFFKDHPEYFAMMDGKRVPYGQLCLTNPDVIRIVTERVLERIRKDPVPKYYGVSQADALCWCECERCTAGYDSTGAYSGPLVAFVNQIAFEVEKEFPGKILETLAYRYTRMPPQRIKLRPNVMICFCSFFRDYREPHRVSSYFRSRDLVRELDGWSRLANHLMIWDYSLAVRHYLMPFPDVMTYKDNIKFYLEKGATEMLVLGSGHCSDFAALKIWLYAKLMWNPDQDVDALIDRFLAGYYGAAAPLVREYFDSIYALRRNTEKMPLTFYEEVDDGNLTDEVLEKGIAVLEAAEELVKGDDVRAQNVREARLSPVYALLLRRARRGGGARGEGRLANAPLLGFFERQMRESGPIRLAERVSQVDANMSAIRGLVAD